MKKTYHTHKCHKCKCKLSPAFEEKYGRTCFVCRAELQPLTEIKTEIIDNMYTSYCLRCGKKNAKFHVKYGCFVCGVEAACRLCGKTFRSIQGARHCYSCQINIERESNKRVYNGGLHKTRELKET